MKSILSYLILFVFIFSASAFGQPKKVPHTFDEITSVIPVSGNQLLISQSGGRYRAKLYDVERDSILQQFIPAGQGFGQSEGIRAAEYDEKTGQFFFFTRSQRWIKTDTKGKIISQTVTHISHVNHICNAPKESMQVFSKQTMSSDDIKNNQSFPVSHRINLSNTKVTDSVMATPGQLQLDEIENISKPDLVSFQFIGHQLNENRLLLTYTGSKYLFLFEDQQFKKKVPVNIPGNFGIRVTTRGDKTGIQSAGVFTNLQHLNNGTLLFSMGNTHQKDLPLGAIYVSVSDDNKIIARHEKLYEGFDDVSGGYNHIITDEARIWFSDFFFKAHSLYKEPLPKRK